jgi:hypothetical protein
MSTQARSLYADSFNEDLPKYANALGVHESDLMEVWSRDESLGLAIPICVSRESYAGAKPEDCLRVADWATIHRDSGVVNVRKNQLTLG